MAKNKAALAAALLLTGSLAALPALFLARGRAVRSLPPSSFAAASAPARAAQAPAAGPGSAAAQDWQTRLVSAAHPLPEDFSVYTAPVEHYPDRRFDARAVDALNALLDPFRERRAYYEAHLDEVKQIIQAGSDKANRVGNETMRRVKDAMQIRL